jgi:ribose 5-phosphate isomerase B
LRIALGSDETSPVTDYLARELKARGIGVSLFGALSANAAVSSAWPDVAGQVAEAVVQGTADEGILLCWTGTGVSIAANKVPGVRAALCGDAETARGAKAWNEANVLCLSLRTTTEVTAREILDAWLDTRPDSSEAANVDKVKALDERNDRTKALLKS